MSIINNNLLLAGTDEGYNLTRSLRFRSSASAYLNRTYVASPTDYRKYTFSAWVKLGALGVSRRLLDAGFGSDTGLLNLNADGTLEFAIVASGSGTTYLKTNNVLRDPSAWYHIVFSCDTSVGSSQFKFYVNGVQASYSTNTAITTNYGTYLNSASAVAQLGRSATYAQYFDGYFAETYFIDGQALTPSSFGSTNTLTGVWQPARYTGTYGTNGFYLPFTDNSALTTSSNVGLGKDFSGNGNYWTTNNISITSGSTYDSMTDVPTLTSATAANFAVLNPLDAPTVSGLAISNANLSSASSSSANRFHVRATIGVNSGKWYWEETVGSVGTELAGVVLSSANKNEYVGESSNGWGIYQPNGNIYNGSGAVAYGSAWDTVSDVLMTAFDANSGKIWWGKNGTWFASGNPATGANAAFTNITGGTVFPAVGDGSGAGTYSSSTNFGQRPFAYPPPSGFVALNAFNLPDSTIVKGNTVMDATLYTGNGSTQTITNAAGFRPDFVWIKNRNNTRWHILTDSVRGTNSQMFSNDTSAQETRTDRLTAFNSNGFSVGSYTDVNLNADTFVAWQWKASGAAVSNTAGTITSQVNVNASAGFSIVTYTGTGANATVGHGLGVAPSMVIVKSRSISDGWPIYHVSLTSAAYIVTLNTTNAQASVPTVWNSTTPTSSVFSIGTSTGTNTASATYVAYCWTPIAGYSAFGSYTGNGSADGPMIYTGFRPKFFLYKRTDRSGDYWNLLDSSRNTYNVATNVLCPNVSDSEYTSGTNIDFVSNGIKIRATDNSTNGSGGTFIYMAFAEVPTKFALAR